VSVRRVPLTSVVVPAAARTGEVEYGRPLVFTRRFVKVFKKVNY
jgi:hypothetical protein